MRRNKKKAYALVMLFVIAVLIVAVYFIADIRMTPVVNTLALSRAQNLATVIINDAVAEILSDNKNDFSGLIVEEYDDSGKIAALSVNSVGMNRLKSLISVHITRAIGEIEESKINIALGTLTGSSLLTGRGPRITLNVHISCASSIEVRNSFEYTGINQTVHKVMLDIKTDVYVLSAGNTLTSQFFTSIPVSETVIIGQIPEIYAGKDDSLWQDLIN